MKTTSSVLILLGFTTLAASYSTVHAQQAAPKSVLDGVYTEAQAKRGEKVYADTCALCHGAKLDGAASGPTLLGPDFTSDWKAMSLAALLNKISMDMPSNSPGTLPPEQYGDVLAYILKVNKYPAGQTELASEVDALKPIRMVEPPK